LLVASRRGVVVKQRRELRVVACPSGGQPDRARGLSLIGQGVDFGGKPAA
jgi:hypothetical protein